MLPGSFQQMGFKFDYFTIRVRTWNLGLSSLGCIHQSITSIGYWLNGKSCHAKKSPLYKLGTLKKHAKKLDSKKPHAKKSSRQKFATLKVRDSKKTALKSRTLKDHSTRCSKALQYPIFSVLVNIFDLLKNWNRLTTHFWRHERKTSPTKYMDTARNVLFAKYDPIDNNCKVSFSHSFHFAY